MVNGTPLCADCDTAENRIVIDIFTEGVAPTMNKHYHVVRFINGCLNDSDSGPYTTLKDARAELKYCVSVHREMGETVKPEGKDRYVSGLYILKIEECTNDIAECEEVY
jgi:hypothetical protein